MPANSAPLSPPPRLAAALADRYRIQRELGAGGMATVYLARDLKHDRDVALKVLRPELAAILGADRFLNEIRITARLSHPHILALIDSGATDGFLYYVLPYVSGESLRDRLRAERQLSLSETVHITSQVAGALDYAHRQGVIHRDIKPENIMLQDGEAMLADFGIALAVKEAGGNRLTETGLSLGTPQYMSPEQATGDRTLDARSDVYSLGTVVYEMLAGEPPISGPSVQAIIAKLLTERPTRLRVVRDSVPVAVDDAVARALAKVPSDRFPTAGAFAGALAADVGTTSPQRITRRWPIAATVAMLLTVGALGWWLSRAPRADQRIAAVSLRDRTQLTSSGRVEQPALSADGKQLAYVTTSCSASGCGKSLIVQNLGEQESRALLTGLQAVNNLEWSPDRRNLLVTANIDGRQGAYLLSVFGGAPRFVSPIWASFYAGGDSMIVVPPQALTGRPVVHLYITGLDGIPRDSIATSGPVDWIYVFNITGTSRFFVLAARGRSAEVRVIDRAGRVTQRGVHGIDPTQSGIWRASRDAIWVQSMQASHPGIVRMSFDSKVGRIQEDLDTVYFGATTGFDVTADGTTVVMDEDAAEYEIWVTSLADALHGRLAPRDLVWRSSAVLTAQLSHDGSRVFFNNTVSGPSGNERQPTVLRVADRSASQLPVRGTLNTAYWVDSVSLAVQERDSSGLRFVLVDSRSGERHAEYHLADSVVLDYAYLPGGNWAWIPSDGQSVRVLMRGDSVPRVFAKPPWFLGLGGLAPSVDGKRLAYGGVRSGFADSARFDVLELASGKIVPWGTVNLAALSSVVWLTDGSLLVIGYESGGLFRLYRMATPGHVVVLGTIPQAAKAVDVSRDLKRAAITVRQDHADAWRWRVVRTEAPK